MCATLGGLGAALSLYIYIDMYIYMYTYIYVYIYIYMYVYIYIIIVWASSLRALWLSQVKVYVVAGARSLFISTWFGRLSLTAVGFRQVKVCVVARGIFYLYLQGLAFTYWGLIYCNTDKLRVMGWPFFFLHLTRCDLSPSILI